MPFVGESRTATGPNATFGYIFGYTEGHTEETSGIKSTTLYKNNGTSTTSFNQSYSVVLNTSTPSKDTTFINGGLDYSYVQNKAWYTCQDYTYDSWYHKNLHTYYFNVPTVLKTVTITDASKIETAAFNNCKNITKIVLNDGITSIGEYAFQNNPW